MSRRRSAERPRPPAARAGALLLPSRLGSRRYGDRRPRTAQPDPSTRSSPRSSTSSSTPSREYLDGRVDEDVFRVFRLNQGVYGQRQGGHNQMLRVKVPHGRVTAEQLETFAYIAETYSRGWGHLTTRQNVQFHFVQLEQTPEVLRLLGVGRPHHRARRAATPCATSWAATSPARARTRCSTSRRGPQATTDLLPAPPVRAAPPPQVQDQLLRLRHRLRPGDVQRRRRDRDHAARSPTAPSSPASRCSSPAVSAPTRTRRRRSRSSPPREDLLPTIEACLRTFDHYGNRDNKIRARMKWLVDTMGIDELRERIIKERKFLRGARDWPGGIPAHRAASTATRPRAATPDATTVGPSRTCR